MSPLSFPTRKLKDSVIRSKKRYCNLKEELMVYGVTNTKGLTITGKKTSVDKSKYLVVSENEFVYNPYRVNVGSIGLAPPGFKGIVSPAYVVFKVNKDICSKVSILLLEK